MIITMNQRQRKQLKEAQKAMIDKDLSTGQIAADLGARPDVISQLINGHYYYPRHAAEMLRRYGILIPDTRDLRRPIRKAA